MRVWQYSTTRGGLEKNLKLNVSAPIPTPAPDQHLVKVIAASLNPIDYKPAENPLIHRLAIPKNATPANDFAGYVVQAAQGSNLKAGQLVYGVTGTSPLAGGALSEYAIAKKDHIVAIPEGVDPTEAATLPVGALTAYQTIVPHVKAGDKVFVNGGSGGVGVMSIQIAKAKGCHVTATCSTANTDLCKSLGADSIIDYKKGDIIQQLKASGQKFDHVVDNVGNNRKLYWKCHEFTKPDALFVQVASDLSLATFWDSFLRKTWPRFLGGGKRQTTGFFASANTNDMRQIGLWIQQRKIKTVIDSRFPFEKAPEAIAKLKTGRAKGKIVVDVSSPKP
jgi:NADPH:quinone reductase-like Zn-dependent oxidoreductase